ncbi:MAG: DEAD/DEAH box helicase [Candidatus Methanospirareceae archaeon]
MGSIKDFEKTCEVSNCPICHRVVERYSKGEAPSKPWELNIELYKWQKEAYKNDGLRTAIIAPTTVLLDQWLVALMDKLNVLKWLIENEHWKDEKILLFHERIEVADEIFNFLKEKEFKVGIYHTELSLDERIKSIADYRRGITNILVSCRALDEGFDVPESEVGVIVAGTSSVQQWIQRMGRIFENICCVCGCGGEGCFQRD